jgi:hypothetical protein
LRIGPFECSHSSLLRRWARQDRDLASEWRAYPETRLASVSLFENMTLRPNKIKMSAKTAPMVESPV